MLTALAPECLATLVRASWRMRYNAIWTPDGRLLKSSSLSLRSTAILWVFVYSVSVSAQCNTQAMVVQHRWVKPAGEPTDLVDGLGSDFPQPMSLCLNICQLPSVFQGTQADQKSGQQLAGFVMQFARNPAPFLLLRRKRAFQKEPLRRFGLFDFLGLLAFLLAQIGDHHAQGLALVSTKPVQRQIDRNQTSILCSAG